MSTSARIAAHVVIAVLGIVLAIRVGAWVLLVLVAFVIAWAIREFRWVRAQRRELLERHQERLRAIAREHGREP